MRLISLGMLFLFLVSCGEHSQIDVTLFGSDKQTGKDDNTGGNEISNDILFDLDTSAGNEDDSNPNPIFQASNVPNDRSILIFNEESCQGSPVAFIPHGSGGDTSVTINGLSDGIHDFYYQSKDTLGASSDCEFMASKTVSSPEFVSKIYRGYEAFVVSGPNNSFYCFGSVSGCGSLDTDGANDDATVVDVKMTDRAAVAMLSDGTAICWGNDFFDIGDCSGVDFNGASDTATVERIAANEDGAAVAILSDGTGICWGDNSSGGDCSAVDFNGASNMETVEDIIPNRYSFVAILSDDTVVCWGGAGFGGDCSGVDFDGASNAETVQSIIKGDYSFVAILTDGSAVCWGAGAGGAGDCSGVDFDGASNTETVVSVASAKNAHAALLSDGTVVCWGDATHGSKGASA